MFERKRDFSNTFPYLDPLALLLWLPVGVSCSDFLLYGHSKKHNPLTVPHILYINKNRLCSKTCGVDNILNVNDMKQKGIWIPPQSELMKQRGGAEEV